MTEQSELEMALEEIRKQFPNSRFRVIVVVEETPRGRRRKKSSATVSVFDNFTESAPTLYECMIAVREWKERIPQ